MANEPIILFDGTCNLCDWTVRFIVRRDPAGRCRFASLQSAASRRLLEPLGLKPQAFDSVVLLADGVLFTKSEAALRIASYLTRPWRWLRLLRIVPRPLRDWVYDLVARHRHRWFGGNLRCDLIPSELRDRFLN